MSEITKPEESSDIPVLELPKEGFKSRIPPSLLAGKPEEEQFILNEVSKMAAFAEWAAPILVSSNLEARKTNGRVKRLEGWKNMFSSWWALGGVILSILGGLATIFSILQFFSPK
jgi:hypothetical protein